MSRVNVGDGHLVGFIATVLLGLLVLGSGLAFLLGALPAASQPLVAQGLNNGRLQLHGLLNLNEEQDGWWAVKVQAVCDTGNGTMLYIARSKDDAGAAVRMQMLPGGCQKAQAEK